MAVEWKVAGTRTSEYFFRPEDIVVKPELNGHHELPDITWLVEDILTQGQLQAVLIRNEGGKPVLCAGFSRWRAVSQINKEKLAKGGEPLKLKCSYFRGNEQEGFLAGISENKIRKDTTPLDDAHNCRIMERWGLSVAEIAARIREKESWVRARLKLSEATPELQQAVKEGRVKPTAAAAIADLDAEHQRTAVQGNGKVKVESTKPGAKDLRAYILESAGDTTQPKAVRDFCTVLAKRWWPKALEKL